MNTTNKRVAAGAACLTLLSYIATAVISATEAMHYAENLLPSLDVLPATIGVLGLFAFLGIMGISESAVVALAIFTLHMTTLVILTVASSIVVLGHPALLIENWHLPSSPQPASRSGIRLRRRDAGDQWIRELGVSILAITAGRIEALAGVYTLAFLSVMALFAVGNMLLKSRRGSLPREVRASWPTVIMALVAVLVGLVGNVLLDPINLEIFQGYFAATVALVAVMFLRLQILKLGLFVSRAFISRLTKAGSWIQTAIHDEMERKRCHGDSAYPRTTCSSAHPAIGFPTASRLWAAFASCSERHRHRTRSPRGNRFHESALVAHFGQEFDLDLLDLDEPLPLVREEMIDLLVELTNLELGLEIDLIVVS